MKKRNVIWISSYPKSGNTLINSVIRKAGQNYGFPQSEMTVYRLTGADQEFGTNPAIRDEYHSNPCVVLKTHNPWRYGLPIHSFANYRLNDVGFIHIYRNPFDLLLSYINYTRIECLRNTSEDYHRSIFMDLLGFESVLTAEEWSKLTLEDIPTHNLNHALRRFSEQNLAFSSLSIPVGSWPNNVKSWFQATEKIDGLLIRYEDCFSNQEEVFSEICRFFKFNRKDIRAALESFNKDSHLMASGENLSKQQSLNHMNTEERKVFFNKMRPYYFPEYFSTDAIAEALEKNKDILTYFGYYEEIRNRIS